jgi:hypothetical protein
MRLDRENTSRELRELTLVGVIPALRRDNRVPVVLKQDQVANSASGEVGFLNGHREETD